MAPADLTGAERTVIDEWIPEAIATVNATLEAIDEGLSERVFFEIAPKGTRYPYIVYQSQTDPNDTRGIGVVSIFSTALYLVKAVGVSSYTKLGAVVAAFHGPLTTSTGGAPTSGGRVLSSVKDDGFSLYEIADGQELRNLGAIYSIQVSGKA